MDKDREIEKLRKENEDLKRELSQSKKREFSNNSAWEFHYSGYGDYDEQRMHFYGDFG